MDPSAAAPPPTPARQERSPLPSASSSSVPAPMAPEEEYILKWRDYQSNFFALAEDLFLNELLTDVTLCCRDQTFEAHRLVLSVCSSYFRSIFTSAQLKQRHPVIFIKDLEPIDLERLLQYMYYGEVKVPNGEMEAFIAAATHLNIRGLSSIQSLPEHPPPPPPPPPEALLSVHEDETIDVTGSPNNGVVKSKKRKRRRTTDDEEERESEATSASNSLMRHHLETEAAVAAAAAAAVTEAFYGREAEAAAAVRGLPLPPPLRKGSSDTEKSRPSDLDAPTKRTRRHSDQTVRTRTPPLVAGHRRLKIEAPSSSGPGHDVDDNDRGVSPPTQIENIPPAPVPPPPSVTPPSPLAKRLHALSSAAAVAAAASQQPTAASMLMLARISAASPSAAAVAMHRLYPHHLGKKPPSEPDHLQRSLPPDEPRKSGTCYFCKKAFMKNKQLMNHVCPKKPRPVPGGGGGGGSGQGDIGN